MHFPFHAGARLRWLTTALLWLLAATVQGQAPRTLLLASVPEDVYQRIAGQVADLPWTLERSTATPATAIARCRDGAVDAALWITEVDDGALTLWVLDARVQQASSRVFPLQPPGDALSRSAQLEALALAARGQLKTLALGPPPPPAPEKPPRTRPRAHKPRAPTPAPADVQEPEPPLEPESPPEPPAPSPEPEPPTGPPAPSPEQEPDAPRFEIRLAYGLRHHRPLPLQHALTGLAAIRLLPSLRAGLGASIASPVTQRVGDTDLRIDRWDLFADLSAPFPLGTHLHLGPALEVGMAQLRRRTERTPLTATGRDTQTILVFRGLATLEVTPAPDSAPGLNFALSAGLELTPNRVVYREQGAAGDADLTLAHLAPTAHLGLLLKL